MVGKSMHSALILNLSKLLDQVDRVDQQVARNRHPLLPITDRTLLVAVLLKLEEYCPLLGVKATPFLATAFLVTVHVRSRHEIAASL